MPIAPTSADVLAAAQRLAGHAVLTPLLQSEELNRRVGGTVLMKAECLQLIGAFKFRGAYNRLVQLTERERQGGVVAWSSGNHAQGVAAAAQRVGVRATIIIPSDAPAIKVDNTRRLGAEIVFYDRQREDREAIGRRLAEERGAALVPSFDDPHIIAGQGTLALETVQQARSVYGREIDAFLAPVSGGGLLAGCILALQATSPRTQTFSVEPAAFDDLARSLASGRRESIQPGAQSICDALQSPRPGELTFPILQPNLAGALRVSDEMALEAMRFAWRELKVVLEPGGAIALAAVLCGEFDCRGRTVALVLSGGNVDPDVYRRIFD